MTISKVTQALQSNPSYLKWGNDRLAVKFCITPLRVSKIKASLKETKRNYLASLSK